MAKKNADRIFWREFLDRYKQFSCLWNSKSDAYSDRTMKRHAYEELIKFCLPRYPEANKDFVVRKIHNFRCAYRRELNKVRKSERTDSGTDDLYVSNLWYFKILSFLRDDETPKSEISNWDEDDNNQDSTDCTTLSPVQSRDDSSVYELHPNSKASRSFACPNFAPSTSSQTATQSTHTPQKGPRKKRTLQSSQTELIALANETLRWVSSDKKKVRNDDDPSDITGRKVAADLKQMSDMQRMIADKIINEVCFYGKAGLLQMSHSFTLQEPQFVTSNQQRSN